MPNEIGQELVSMLPRLRRYALTLCKSRELADDLVQGACERALGASASRRDGVPFDAWVFRILRNFWIDGLRRQRTEGLSVDIEEHHDLVGSDGGVETEARLTLERVQREIDRLPEEQREVLLLVSVEEFSYKQAAETLGLPIGTVMSRLSRGRLRLAELSGIESIVSAANEGGR